MTVYVDRGRVSYRRMFMCHMVADTLEELHAMAEKLRLRREWFQDHATPHYDICQAKRKEAVKLGAKEIDRRQVVSIIRRWRALKGGIEDKKGAQCPAIR